MSQTGLAFALLYLLGLALALFVRPMYGLYVYVAVFYLHPPSRWWGQSLPDLRWSLLAAVVTLVALVIHSKALRDKEAWYRSAIIKILIVYTLWMWIQYPWVASVDHPEGAILFTKYVLLAFLMYTIIDNEQDLRGFCIAHVIGCAYFGWIIYTAPDTGRFESVGGPGVDNANTLGMHLGTGLMFASFLILAVKGKWRWLIVLTIPFILNGIMQTQTRGALVGLVLGGLVTVFLKPKRFRRAYYALAVMGLIGFGFLANEAFINRMESLNVVVDDDREWDSSAYSRIAIAQAQWSMFKDHPLGVGHQGTAFLSRQYLEERWLASNSGDRASHNTVLSALVDQGLPGILLVAAMLFVVVRVLRKLKRMDAAGLPETLGLYRTLLGGSLATILGAGMFAQYIKAEVQIWCLILLAVLWRLAQDGQRVQWTDPALLQPSAAPAVKGRSVGRGRDVEAT